MNISRDKITDGLGLCKQRQEIEAVASMDLVKDNISREFGHATPTKAHYVNLPFKSESGNGVSSADTPHFSTEGTPGATEKSVFFEPSSLKRAQNQGSLNPLTICMEDYQSKFPRHGMCDQETIPDSNAAAKTYCDGDRNWMLSDAGAESKRESDCMLWTMTEYRNMDLANPPLLLDLPTDRSRSLQQVLTGAQLPIQIDSQLTQFLRELAQDHAVNIPTILLVAWSAILSRLSGQEKIVIRFRCVDVFHRNRVSCSPGNQLLLGINLSGDPNTVQLLKQVKQTSSMATGHQDILLEDIAETAQPHSQEELCWFSFDWSDQGCHSSTMALTQERNNAPVQFDLQLNFQDVGDEIFGSIHYAAALFDSTTIERHVGYLSNMLSGMVFDVMQPVTEIDVTSPVEQKLRLKTWNTTSPPFPEHQTIHNRFEEQAEHKPEAIALVHEGQSLTYAKLNARANHLAHHLIGLGIQPDERVAICTERSLEMIIGLLAILKAGGAYVPIDPAYPRERFIHILSDASPAILLADNAGQKALGETILASLTIVDPSLHHETDDSNPHVPGLSPRHLAYVIYTSGSTGKPKGVMIEHRSVVNMAHSHTTTFGVHQGSRVLQFATLSFDSSVSEIFMALSCGASLYLPSDSAQLDRSKLWEYLETNSITHATFTPSILQDGKDLPNWNEPLTLILGGEALNAALLRQLVCHGPVFNDYGPTETTVGAIVWRASQDFSGDIVPIGRPHKNYRIYLLDARMQPVALGVIGEIYISGIGVARGYLNKPELTAERFLPDPFVGDAEARMYKTGDLARYLPDGNLVYLGRNDDQVKIRGIRIETGEIEARLAEHVQVQEVAVVALGEEDDKRLVAYVVAPPIQYLAHELRMHLTTRLPEYMIPAAFVRVDALPLNTNGKLDRQALPKPDKDAFARQTYEAPQGEMEIALAEIWAQLLGVEHISRHDNFFGLGGHSLLVVRVLACLQCLGLSVPVRMLFESPTLSVLAVALSAHKAVSTPPNLITLESTALTPDMLPLIELTQSDICHIVQNVPGGIANIQDIYILSPLQHGILFHHLLTTEGDPYLSTMSMAFQSRELLDRYLSAFQRVIDRHDILRTMFIWENLSAPAQVVCRRAPLTIMEVTLNPTDGPVMEQLDKRFNPSNYRIDLWKAPLVQFVVAQDTDDRWLLVQLMHHLVGDHSAAEMMNFEIQAFLEGQDHSLPTPRPFRDLVAQTLSNSNPEAHDHFFKEMLANVDEPTLPFGLAGVYNNGSKDSESHQMLPDNLNVRLRSHAKRLGVSVASLCHVAWAQVLALTSGQQRVVFGTVLSGQLQTAGFSDQAMGLSINTLPFRCDMDNRDIQTCIQETHSSLAALLEHEHASLALAQQCSGVPPGTALFSGLLNYRHTSLPSSNSSRTTGTEFWSQEERVHYPGIEFLGGQERTNYPFTLSVEDFGMHLGLTVQVMHPVDPARVRGYMQQTLESLVEALECKLKLPVSHLQMLPMEERNLLLRTWNETQQDFPEHDCIHHLFEQSAAHTPEAVALVFEDQILTYAELNARANHLAHHLIGLGIQPDERVAICTERSLEMIIGLLAILKAGGAYVPIDPAYPRERFIHILSDASPAILLADNAGQKALGVTILASLTIVDPSLHHETDDSNPHVPGLSPRHLAYVIYTSGSTGKPKGVMIEHRSVVNMAHSHTATFGVHQGSRVLQFATFSFDSSVSQIFMALSCGASLYLPPDSARLDRDKLWEYLNTNSITFAAFTPSVLQDGKDLPNMNGPLTLALCGEALNAALLRQLVCHGPVFNDYGPTETTVGAIVWRASQDFSGDIVPIGRPHKNYRIYLLDTRMQPVALGVIGEIFISGIGVARGYLNRPELTAERFLPDPFVGDAEARMYKTGDLARYLPDGNLVYLGRNDDQVKIRGIRIETGEIEARLAEHAQVQEVAVVALGEEDDKRLVAYVVAPPIQYLAHELRMHLTTRLPEYMIPAAFVRVDALPLNANGKLDRQALPIPSEDAFACQAYEAPQGDIEIAISNIWQELLKVDKIGRHGSFFMLGGHSLLAMRMINRLRTMLGLVMTPRTLFEAPTIAELAKRLLKAENTQASSYDVLLPIRPQGTRRPLFCVHHAFGMSSCYIGLLTHLHTDQPVYGLQARGLFGDEQLPASLDEMATDYILQIRSIQPHGPYYLLGYSFGGTVVHTMAKLLEEQGEKVALVALMDTPSDYHICAYGDDEDDASVFRLLAGGNEDVISEEMKSDWKHAPKIVQNNSRLASQHAPPIYSGDILFFRATELEDMESLVCEAHWEPYVLGDIEVIDIHCTHNSMDHPQPMAEIGRILAQKLEALHDQEAGNY